MKNLKQNYKNTMSNFTSSKGDTENDYTEI